VTLLSCFAHNPRKLHWTAIKDVLAYIKGTLNYGITYKADVKLNPSGYVNSDFAGCKDTGRSTEGNIFIVVGGPGNSSIVNGGDKVYGFLKGNNTGTLDIKIFH